jgi:hypothetical protein
MDSVLARAALCCPRLYCLYRRTCPLEYMEDLGFGELVLVSSFAVSMSGG